MLFSIDVCDYYRRSRELRKQSKGGDHFKKRKLTKGFGLPPVPMNDVVAAIVVPMLLP